MNIAFTLHWWFIPIILFLSPVVYAFFRPDQGGYDFQIDTMIILFACWAGAIGVLLGKIF